MPLLEMRNLLIASLESGIYLKVSNQKRTSASPEILFPLVLPFSLELATRRKGVEKARNRRKFPDNSNFELENWFCSMSSPSSSLDRVWGELTQG